jgi:hypothetical protein
MKANLNISEEQRKAISTYLNLNIKFKNAYFWSSPCKATDRRKYEERNSFYYEDERFTLDFGVSCSASHIYINKKVIVDGKETNATSLKKFVR